MKKISDVVSYVFIVIAVIFFAVSLTFPPGTNGAVGPGWFPRILCVLIILLCAINLYTTNYAFKRMTPEEQEADLDKTRKIFSKENSRVWISVLATFVYILCINYIGFVVSSLVYMYAMSIYYKTPEKSKVVTAVLPIIVVAVLYYVFSNLLHVVLPGNLLF